MTDRTDSSVPPQRQVLESYARETGDPGMFPPEVLRLASEGRARKAHAAMLRHAAKEERDPRRAARQRDAAELLRLWLDPAPDPPSLTRINGIGAQLLGSHQEDPDGTHIATQWFTVLFIPVLPIGAWLVVRDGDGWRILARAPLPPLARQGRRVAGAIAAVLAVAALGLGGWNAVHTEVIAYNGFDRPVTVQVGRARREVAPLAHIRFGNVPARRVLFRAEWADQPATLESTVVDLGGHGIDHVIYNVGARGLLRVSVVAYGAAEEVPSRLLGPGAVVFEPRLDHVFTLPPDSVSVAVGGSARRTVLHVSDEGADAGGLATDLFRDGYVAQARDVAEAELRAHPDRTDLLWFVIKVLRRDDPEAQLSMARAFLRWSPENVELHRIYQNVREADSLAVRAEYDSLAAAQPASAMYAYLAGRALGAGSEAALVRFRTALALDPGYLPVHRSLAHSAIVRGRWAEALAHLERFASLDKDAAVESFGTRLRLLRFLGRPMSEQSRLIASVKAARPDWAYPDLIEAQVRVEGAPSRWVAEYERVARRTAERFDPEVVRDILAPTIRAGLAVTAGDLAEARLTLRGMARPEHRDASTVARLALSGRAADEDVKLLQDVPRWFAHLDAVHQLAALELVPPGERQVAAAQMIDPELPALVPLLDDPARLTDPGAVDRAVSDLGLEQRVAMYLAAAQRLAREPAPTARAARARYLARARAFALPGELPSL